MPHAFKTGRYSVYTATRATLAEWTHSARCSVVSFRRQVQGMGSAVMRLEQTPPGDDPELNLVPDPNDWVAIIDSVLMPSFWERDYLLDVRSLMTESPCPVVWLGRCSSVPEEVHQGDIDRHGVIEANEAGFFLLGQAVSRLYTHPGYNPVVDGVQRGNYVSPGRVAALPDEMGDPTDTAYAWTPRRVVEDLCENTLSFKIRPVFTAASHMDFLDRATALSSYEGSDLLSALQELLNPLTFRFKLSNTAGYILDMEVITSFRTTPPQGWHDHPESPPTPDPFIPNVLDLEGTPCRRLVLNTTEEKYDRVVLQGPRIRIAASITTFGPRRVDADNVNMCPVILPNWAGSDALDYAEAEVWTPSSWEVEQYVTDKGLDPSSDEGRDLVQQLEQVNRAYRTSGDRNKVYQEFVFRYDPAAITSESPTAAIYTAEHPGIVGAGIPLPVSGHTHNTVYATFPHQLLFPRFTLQDTTTFKLYRDPVVMEGEHATPNPAALEVMREVPIYDENGQYLEPMAFARGIGSIDEAEVDDYRYPFWFDLTLPASNKQTVNWSVNGFRIRLDAASPELMACSDPALFKDRVGVDGGSISASSFWGVDGDKGEWAEDNEDQGYSDRNPDAPRYLSESFWPDRCHWSRVVLTLGFLSDQRYEVIYQAPGVTGIVEKEKVIEDPDLIMDVTLRGVVTGLQTGFLDGERSISELVYYDHPTTVTRKPVAEANALLWALWEWYSKVKRAITVEWSLMHAPGVSPDMVYHPPYDVGDIIDRVDDPKPSNVTGSKRQIAVNTSVTTVEVFVDDDQPRTVLTTEVPSAPPFSRFRRMQVSG